MKNNYKLYEEIIDQDTWHIHYLRVNEKMVRITCDLMRPNRKFWQSKTLWYNWTYCSAEDSNLLKTLADNLIVGYYNQKRAINTLDDFFETES